MLKPNDSEPTWPNEYTWPDGHKSGAGEAVAATRVIDAMEAHWTAEKERAANGEMRLAEMRRVMRWEAREAKLQASHQRRWHRSNNSLMAV